jgi:hypothetical protein
MAGEAENDIPGRPKTNAAANAGSFTVNLWANFRMNGSPELCCVQRHNRGLKAKGSKSCSVSAQFGFIC